MSLVFSASVPHPPLLIPQIGKEHIKRLEQTQKAYGRLAVELSASQAETVIIFSAHGIIQTSAFTMNLNPKYRANFEEFGDFSTKLQFDGNIGLAYKIREKLETKSSLQLASEENIDYGISVPLFIFSPLIPKIKIIPIYPSGLDLKAHFSFGQLLGKLIQNSKENIAVISSADLSHRLNKNAPGGYSPKAKKFDAKVIELLLKKEMDGLLSLDENLIQDAGECGFKPLLILAGTMDETQYEPQLLSYEAPFGVGYMVMNFKL